MTPVARLLDQLEQKIERLRREYDLFLAGNRKGAPIAQHDEIEREIQRLTRAPTSSTAIQFRLKSLAHRFQALATQVRQRSEPKRPARVSVPDGGNGREPSVLLDRAALANPAAVELHLKQMHRALAMERGEGFSLERLRERLLGEASRRLEQAGVRGIRFRVVKEAEGSRIRGELLTGRED